MKKIQTDTQPQPLPSITPESAETSPIVDPGSILATAAAPKLKDIAVLITSLHSLWDDIIAHGYNPELEFMSVINAKLSGKTHDQVKALHEQAEQNRKELSQQEAHDAEWQQRSAEFQAEAQANLQTRIDRPKKNSRR